MSFLQVNLPTGIMKTLIEGEENHDEKLVQANKRPAMQSITMKNMKSDNQASTQPTHQEGPFTMSTPKGENFENIAFDLTHTGGSRKYFEEIKEGDGNINIIPVNSKRLNSSVSEEPASARKLGEQTGLNDVLVPVQTIKSKSTGLIKSYSSKMEHSHGELLRTGWEENKPSSLSLLSLKNAPQPRRTKKLSGWLLQNRLERASETDSMHVSTNVIRIQESKDMMGIGLDNEVSEEGSPVPLETYQKKTEQKKVTRCPMPRSLEGSQKDVILPQKVEYEEEAEDPMSDDEDEEAGQEEMEHSIPDSFDE